MNYNNYFAVYIVLNERKEGIEISFDWNRIPSTRFKSKCSNLVKHHNSVINFNKITNHRETCYDNSCICKDENLLGIYTNDKLDKVWIDLYSFIKFTIEQKLDKKHSILDIMERKLHKIDNNTKLETNLIDLHNIVRIC